MREAVPTKSHKGMSSGGYDRLADAAEQGQAAPQENVYLFKAAMPDRDRVRATAQLTDGAASWASPNSFSVRQLWEWTPVDIFVQAFGTTKSVPNLSELIASGVRLRKPGTDFLLSSNMVVC